MRVRVVLELMGGEYEVTLDADEYFDQGKTLAVARETLASAVDSIKRGAGL